MATPKRQATYGQIIHVLDNLPLIVAETRRARGVTLRELGRITKLSASSIARFEKGDGVHFDLVMILLRWVESGGANVTPNEKKSESLTRLTDTIDSGGGDEPVLMGTTYGVRVAGFMSPDGRLKAFEVDENEKLIPLPERPPYVPIPLIPPYMSRDQWNRAKGVLNPDMLRVMDETDQRNARRVNFLLGEDEEREGAEPLASWVDEPVRMQRSIGDNFPEGKFPTADPGGLY